MSPSQESHAEPNNITNVEQPPAASTEIPSNDQQQSDAHAEARPESPHKTSKRKSHKKPKKKAAKKKGALPTHLQVIRDEIDSLKAQLVSFKGTSNKDQSTINAGVGQNYRTRLKRSQQKKNKKEQTTKEQFLKRNMPLQRL